jgi:hypothetical protein
MEQVMENTKTLLAIFVIVAVFMMNYLCGAWITHHGKKSVSK